jgi:transcriptional regulator with XRE-family HTH domain
MNKQTSDALGKRIRSARKAAKLTLEELGRRIGISNQALSAIENGKKNPSRQTLMGLSMVLGNDFGEKWLAEYLTERGGEYLLLPGKNVPSFDKRKLTQLFEEFLESKFESDEIRFIEIHGETGVTIPLTGVIKNGNMFDLLSEDKYISIPSRMVYENKKALAILVDGKPIRDACVIPGDVLILTESPDSIEGKVIFGLLDGIPVIKRWFASGRKLTLTSIDQEYGPVIVQRKAIKYIGEITGLLRYFK